MAGIGKDVVFGDDYFVSFKGGYKIVFRDGGFGSETIVNSIGNKEAQKYIERFFDPKQALGPPRGDMMSMRIGFGKYMGSDRKTCLGMEIYGDLDLTNETLRIARMNAIGNMIQPTINAPGTHAKMNPTTATTRAIRPMTLRSLCGRAGMARCG